MTQNFQVPCAFCGTVNISELAIPSTQSTFILKCSRCSKVIVEFFEEKDDALPDHEGDAP